jgi:hypothetical protein
MPLGIAKLLGLNGAQERYLSKVFTYVRQRYSDSGIETQRNIDKLLELHTIQTSTLSFCGTFRLEAAPAA